MVTIKRTEYNSVKIEVYDYTANGAAQIANGISDYCDSVRFDMNRKVSGEVVNKSSATLRDVQLLILYSWLWKNEFHPGQDDPGRAVYLTVDKEIPPGQSAQFNYKPSPPLPERKDGYFDISTKVVGFTQVYR